MAPALTATAKDECNNNLPLEEHEDSQLIESGFCKTCSPPFTYSLPLGLKTHTSVIIEKLPSSIAGSVVKKPLLVKELNSRFGVYLNGFTVNHLDGALMMNPDNVSQGDKSHTATCPITLDKQSSTLSADDLRFSSRDQYYLDRNLKTNIKPNMGLSSHQPTLENGLRSPLEHDGDVDLVTEHTRDIPEPMIEVADSQQDLKIEAADSGTDLRIESAGSRTDSHNFCTEAPGSSVEPQQLLDELIDIQRQQEQRSLVLMKRLRRLEFRQLNTHYKSQLSGLTMKLRPTEHTASSTNGILCSKKSVTVTKPSWHLTTVPKLGEDLKSELDQFAGQSSASLKHLAAAVDSDATDSSSGGESSDEASTETSWREASISSL